MVCLIGGLEFFIDVICFHMFFCSLSFAAIASVLATRFSNSIREKRYLLREDSDKNIFDKLDKYQINTSHSIKISDYIIDNNDNMDELVINFNQLYKYLKNE